MDTNGDNPSNNPIPIHNEINYEQFLLATINNRINSDRITVMLLVRNTTTGERKMKLAWICYDDDEEYPQVYIKFEEPESYLYNRIVPIVYAEIKND